MFKRYRLGNYMSFKHFDKPLRPSKESAASSLTSEAIIQSRSPDTPKAMVVLEGGTEPGHRCQSRSHGIEETLINTAAAFILKN